MSTSIADMPRGIDVSKFQGDVDWNLVAGEGVKFAFARAVEDEVPGDKADHTFADNFAGMKAAGILRGAYHFFRPRRDAVAQAKLFVSIVGELKPGDLPPVIDLEHDGSSKLLNLPAVSAKVIIEGMARWIDVVEDALNRQVIIYTNAEYWLLAAGNSKRFRDHPLWIAHYKVDRPIVPSAFPSFAFHQYDVEQTLPGVPRTGPLVYVPTDRFNGSVNELRALADLPPIEGDSPVPHMQPRFAVAKIETAARAATAKGGGKGGKKAGAAAKKSAKKGASKSVAAKKAGSKVTTKKKPPAARKGSSKKAAGRGSRKVG